jgi:hypothetical protein
MRMLGASTWLLLFAAVSVVGQSVRDGAAQPSTPTTMLVTGGSGQTHQDPFGRKISDLNGPWWHRAA